MGILNCSFAQVALRVYLPRLKFYFFSVDAMFLRIKSNSTWVPSIYTPIFRQHVEEVVDRWGDQVGGAVTADRREPAMTPSDTL